MLSLLVIFAVISWILSECILVQNNFWKLNYAEKEGYRDYAVGTGNSHMRFYDVTSWSYVNLDDPTTEIQYIKVAQSPFANST